MSNFFLILYFFFAIVNPIFLDLSFPSHKCFGFSPIFGFDPFGYNDYPFVLMYRYFVSVFDFTHLLAFLFVKSPSTFDFSFADLCCYVYAYNYVPLLLDEERSTKARGNRKKLVSLLAHPCHVFESYYRLTRLFGSTLK